MLIFKEGSESGPNFQVLLDTIISLAFKKRRNYEFMYTSNPAWPYGCGYTYLRHVDSTKLRHYSNFGRHVISRSPAGHAWETLDKRHRRQQSIEPTRFVDFCLIPLSNTCSLVQPARNVSSKIFLNCQEGRVVDQAVLDNRPLRKHFRRSRLH